MQRTEYQQSPPCSIIHLNFAKVPLYLSKALHLKNCSTIRGYIKMTNRLAGNTHLVLVITYMHS